MTNTDKTLKINIRNVYGVAKAYPADETAEHFAALAGSKTLTLQALREIDALGYTIFNTYALSIVGTINPHDMRDLSAAI